MLCFTFCDDCHLAPLSLYAFLNTFHLNVSSTTYLPAPPFDCCVCWYTFELRQSTSLRYLHEIEVAALGLGARALAGQVPHGPRRCVHGAGGAMPRPHHACCTCWVPRIFFDVLLGHLNEVQVAEPGLGAHVLASQVHYGPCRCVHGPGRAMPRPHHVVPRASEPLGTPDVPSRPTCGHF